LYFLSVVLIGMCVFLICWLLLGIMFSLGGYLVSTFRLTDGEGCNDISRSYQYINFDGILEGELASYVVLNAKDLLQHLRIFDPSEINAYGYWGAPSATAVKPYGINYVLLPFLFGKEVVVISRLFTTT
jgi:hypothetical protein